MTTKIGKNKDSWSGRDSRSINFYRQSCILYSGQTAIKKSDTPFYLQENQEPSFRQENLFFA